MKKAKNRLFSFLLYGLLLLSLCACAQTVQVSEPQEPMAVNVATESPAPPITTAPRDYAGEWEALVQEYHTDEWLWSEATPCAHGNPTDYADRHALRVKEDGTVEELTFCNYTMYIYASDNN